MKYLIMPMLLASMFLLASCSEDSFYNVENNSLTITLQMPGKQTNNVRRVALNPIENSKDFYATWSTNDKVQGILRRGNEIYDLGRALVTDISEDKRTATINFDRRATPNVSPPYSILLFAGNDNTAKADAIGGGNWAGYCTYELQRAVGGYFHAPLYCRIEVKSDGNIPTAQFQHFGTYEILHVRNATNLPITFAHQGFQTDKPWYQATTTMWFYDGYDPSPNGEWDGDTESQSMTIVPNSENLIYSWYIPSGFPVKDARLISCINGNRNIQSTNTFSSNIIPQRGHAYHMYAEWNGKDLTINGGEDVNEEFDNEDKVFTVNGVSFTMKAVEGGTFTMGSPDDDSEARDNEKPAHSVTLSSFWMGQTEVTQALWEAVMGSNPSSSKSPDKPVEGVSWNDCQEFIQKLNAKTGETFRLPTEAEWEYAARGGNKSKGYKYSGSNDISNVAWYNYDYASSQKVATRAPNELGLYDMSGNVRELCYDWYESSYYSSSPSTNPKGPISGVMRVHRGGSWIDDAERCRVASRDYIFYEDRGYTGLRLVLVSNDIRAFTLLS